MTDLDWSAGDWESTCRTRLVRQMGPNDCGVACLAMAAGISYDDARATFVGLGLDDPATASGSVAARRKSKPFSSNFKELGKALQAHGARAELQRWRGWESFGSGELAEPAGTIGIIKVQGNVLGNALGKRSRNWHWIVAEVHGQYGLVVRDPESPLVGLRNPPMGVCYREIEWVAPEGCCWIRVVRPDSVEVGGIGAGAADAGRGNTPGAVKSGSSCPSL